MSSSRSLARKLWLVVAPDLTDQDALARRLKVRMDHLDRAKEDGEKGVLGAK